MQMRFDPSTGIYRDCRWCEGKGCVSCKIEADKEYKRQFPDGPKPIATFSMEDILAGKLNGLLSPEGIESARVEARERATETLSRMNIGSLVNCTQEEAVDALEASLINDVLVDRIKAAGTS